MSDVAVADVLGRFDDAVTALMRIAAALERLSLIADDVSEKGRVHVDGLIVTREDRP